MANTYIPIFAVGKYSSIAPAIESGTIQYPSYVLCTGEDENYFVFVDKDSNIRKIKGYNQDSVLTVDSLPTTGIRTDAFYICDGKIYIYLDDTWVSVLNGGGVTSYNDLEDIPITNEYGTASDPVIISELTNGLYTITGNYQITSDGTTYITSRHILFAIDFDYENRYITKFGSGEIDLYIINLETEELISTEYATQEWVKEQGYLTDEDLESISNEEIANLFNREK